MQLAAIGIEDHNGWANFVSVIVSGDSISVLDRYQTDLIDPDLPNQPYHHETLEMETRAAEELVQTVKVSAASHAQASLERTIRTLAPDATCVAIAIRHPPIQELPRQISEVHANSRIMYAADGMIYHQALTQAAMGLDLTVSHFNRGTVLSEAAALIGEEQAVLLGKLKALAAALGPPWRKPQISRRRCCASACLIQR